MIHSSFLLIHILNLASRLEGIKSFLKSLEDDLGNSNTQLAAAAYICEEMRAAVFKETGFKCSAGISHNKVSLLEKPLKRYSIDIFFIRF